MDTLLIYLFAMTITPGPNTILSMANAAAVGLRKGIWLNIGMLVGLTAVTAIAYIASASLYALIPSIEPWLKAIGAAYLVYLAYRTYRKGSIETEEKSAGFAEAIRIAISMLIPLACFAGGLVWAVGGSLLSGIYQKHGKSIGIIMALLLIYTAIRFFV